MPARASVRTLLSPGCSRTPTRRPATTRSSTRPCDASRRFSSSVSTPGTRKSASFDSRPSSSSRTAPPTTYASSSSERTYSSSCLADSRDRLDLHERAGREFRDLDGRARGRLIADVLRVHGVHPLEVVEVLEEHRRLHEAVETRSRLLENRAQVREHLLGLLFDRAARQLLVAGPKGELAGHEHEITVADRLRVRGALERRGCRFGAHDGLAHSLPPSIVHACASATPSALKIASSTCWVSVPLSSRTCSVTHAPSAKRSRKRRATSVPRPPTRACVRSTLVTTSGVSDVSRTTLANASAEVIDANPYPRPARTLSARALPSARPASATSASPVPGS